METEQPHLLKLSRNRNDIHDFAFLVEDKEKSNNDNPTTYRHELLGLPAIPFLGKYSGSSYEFGQVLSLVSLQIEHKKKASASGWTLRSGTNGEIKLPQDIQDLLLNVPLTIQENKKEEYGPKDGDSRSEPKGGRNQKNTREQRKLTSFFTAKINQEDYKEYEREFQKDKNYFKYDSKTETKSNPPVAQNQAAFIATNKVKFSWIIQLNNMELSPQLKKEPLLIVNYVMHTVLFPYISFEKLKRLTAKTPVGLVVPRELKDKNGVYEFVDSVKGKGKFYSGLRVGDLRLEYSSVHLKEQSLCFSPNNMKVVVDRTVPIGVFWTVVLDETMQSNSCYLHWIVNDSLLFDFLKKICKEAKCLDDLFKELENLLGNTNEVLSYTKGIFEAR